ncbi:uncharacterized protein LOC126555674, partial [Aphis gossypii]|uniref:uncharacterized protein LOC126555674 n=1 Tax=Aphis gossypii TaxID=80765 RepID=UPI00215982A2
METITSSTFVETKSAFDGLCKEYFKKNPDCIKKVRDFLDNSKPEIYAILINSIKNSPVKYNIKLEATYIIPNTDTKENRAFKTRSRSLFQSDDVNNVLESDFIEILQEQEDMELKGSGFSLESIDGIILNVNVYKPLGGSSYIPLPAFIERKKATINVLNFDEKCFKYSILAKLVNPVHAERIGSNYVEVENRYNFKNVNFPASLNDVVKFEKTNKVSVNIYSLKNGELKYKNNVKKKNSKRINYTTTKPEQTIVYPVKVCEEELDDHHDLLLFGDGTGKQHYCRITNLAKLIGAQLTKNGHAMSLCKRCFKTYFGVNRCGVTAEQRLNNHKLNCNKNKPLIPLLPRPNTYMKFENWERTRKHPFSIYADFESILEKNSNNDSNNTNIIHHHDVMSYCYYVKPSDDIPKELLDKYDIEMGPVVFRGDSSFNRGDVAKKFMEEIVKVALKIEKIFNVNVPIVMTDENKKNHQNVVAQGSCPLCKSKFIKTQNNAVKDHDHLTGKYRGTVCSKCNLLMEKPSFVPIFFHNLSGYDSHFIVTQLGFNTKSITVIPNTEEKLISFTKYISNTFQIRFVDTFRFMSTSLEKLVNNLAKGDTLKFRDTRRVFNNNDIELVTRKGVYCYEYTDSWEKLSETALPSKEHFYSTLHESHIDDADYEHAIRVWEHFNLKTLGEYSDLYIKVDVMLLCDVFENFRDLCLVTYGLDPNYYYTAPGMSFDCCLKITEVQLELLSDYDQLLMTEAAIRGGLTQASMRYAQANNNKVPDYDSTKPDSWIAYLDATNLFVLFFFFFFY